VNAYLFYDPRARPLSIAGAILPGAVLRFFITGTLTPTPVYSDAALTTPLGTEVEADENGQFPPIYLSPLITYRVQMYDADLVLLPDGDVDPLCPKPDFPVGTVMWFHGTAAARDAAYPPAQWQVLDGSNGTPDGRDRFPIIAGGALVSGDIGGAVGGVSTTTAAGAHDHGGVVSTTVLDATNMPTHNHRLYVRTSATQRGNTRGFGFASTAGVEGQIIDDAPYGYLDTAPSSGGNKLIEDNGSGSPTGHAHNITAAVNHQHDVSINPPYVALWALMRRA
jgi:hypothetical protein